MFSRGPSAMMVAIRHSGFHGVKGRYASRAVGNPRASHHICHYSSDLRGQKVTRNRFILGPGYPHFQDCRDRRGRRACGRHPGQSTPSGRNPHLGAVLKVDRPPVLRVKTRFHTLVFSFGSTTVVKPRAPSVSRQTGPLLKMALLPLRRDGCGRPAGPAGRPVRKAPTAAPPPGPGSPGLRLA